MNEPVYKNESALHKILSWSEMLPEWGKDALRRIITNGPCSETDIKEIFNLAIKDIPGYSLPSSMATAIHFSEVHIPPMPGDEQSVCLVSLSNLQFVNRLPSDQVIPLGGAKGINLIYGNNGSGKSGYARVLKKACRARGSAQDIQPDAFSSIDPEPARACIEYSFENNIHKFDWIDDCPTDDKLSNVFVFDTIASENYLSLDNSACFTPFGLDILPKLASVFDGVQKMISTEITSLETKNDKNKETWKYSDHTEVGKYLFKLSTSSNRQKLDTLTVFTDEMKSKKNDIENSLKSDPEKQINLTEAAIKRLESFIDIFNEIIPIVGKENVDAVLNAINEYNDALSNNKSVSENKFKNSKLNGVGSTEWKELWDKAAEYSNKQAYPANKFPNVDNALCVLCQQPITEEPKNRLLSFNKDINDASQTTLKEKTNILKKYSDTYNVLPDIKSELQKIKADVKIYLKDDKYEALEKGVDSIHVIFEHIKQVINRKIYREINPADVSSKKVIDDIVLKFKERLKIEKSASNPEERTKYLNELEELKDKEWLSNNKSEVVKYLDNLRKISHLQDKKTETNTKNISIFTTELTNTFVTEKFCNTFALELQKLGLLSIKVQLTKKRSKKAITEFGLIVENAEGWKVKDVASEGEQRCIALACFLAELSQSSHNSALVFDDPVSSLDHNYRRRIATRLAEESLNRQVIIFTHDIAFLNDIIDSANEINASFISGYLDWKGANPGYFYQGLPWKMKSPEDKINTLQQKITVLQKKSGPVPSQEIIAEILENYSLLRSVIERIIEQHVFANVINRYRDYIDVKHLKRVVGFTEEERLEVVRLFDRCCKFTSAHDASSSKQDSLISPDDLKNDIEATLKLIALIKKRHSSIK